MAFDIVEFVKKTFNPQAGERFLFMVDDSDEKRNELVKRWNDELREKTNLVVYPVLYHAQTTGNGADLPEEFNKERINIKQNRAVASLYVAIPSYPAHPRSCQILEEADIVWSLPRYSATRPLSLMAKKLGFRVASSPNFQLDMIDTIMTENPEHIQKRGEILLPRLKLAKGVEIYFKGSGKVYFDIRNVPWEEDLGKIFNKGDVGNIPFGELCGPQHEGSLLEYLLENKRYEEANDLVEFYRKHEVLPKSLVDSSGKIIKTETEGFVPVYQGNDFVNYSIKGGFVRCISGMIIEETCEIHTKTNENIKEQREKLSKDPLWGYIAEVAFGLNSKASKESPYTLEQEKSAPHFALGNAAQVLGFPTPISKELNHHHDYTMVNPKILEAKLIYPGNYEETIVKDGKYTIFGELNF